MARKLLVICGLTATGKTSLALHLSKVFEGEIVSADSRQVYRGMDIGTGKDLPVNSKFKIQKSKLGKEGIGFYEVNGVKIWGYDLVSAKDEFSVARYIRIADSILEDIWSRGKLPILVGGTGLYIKGVIDGIPTASIPRNAKLRKRLAMKSVEELFETLQQLDAAKAESLNISDRKNKRRLIRAIDIGQWRVKHKEAPEVTRLRPSPEVFFIGLAASRQLLEKRIRERIEQRLERGFEREIEKLTRQKNSWESQSMNSIGYRQWKGYIKGIKTREEALIDWEKAEKDYAKRQIAWFKKDKRIHWIDISKNGWQKSVEKLVGKWYSSEKRHEYTNTHE